MASLKIVVSVCSIRNVVRRQSRGLSKQQKYLIYIFCWLIVARASWIYTSSNRTESGSTRLVTRVQLGSSLLGSARAGHCPTKSAQLRGSSLQCMLERKESIFRFRFPWPIELVHGQRKRTKTTWLRAILELAFQSLLNNRIYQISHRHCHTRACFEEHQSHSWKTLSYLHVCSENLMLYRGVI